MKRIDPACVVFLFVALPISGVISLAGIVALVRWLT
jgi:hypothetical protein